MKFRKFERILKSLVSDGNFRREIFDQKDRFTIRRGQEAKIEKPRIFYAIPYTVKNDEFWMTHLLKRFGDVSVIFNVPREHYSHFTTKKFSFLS